MLYRKADNHHQLTRLTFPACNKGWSKRKCKGQSCPDIHRFHFAIRPSWRNFLWDFQVDVKSKVPESFQGLAKYSSTCLRYCQKLCEQCSWYSAVSSTVYVQYSYSCSFQWGSETRALSINMHTASTWKQYTLYVRVRSSTGLESNLFARH